MPETPLHFDGDPETESARRHMERVLKAAENPPRRWPWVLGLLLGSGSWMLWRRVRNNYPER